jgi:autotransporter-associated beta strand protein
LFSEFVKVQVGVGTNDTLSNLQTVIIDSTCLLEVVGDEAWGGLSGSGEMKITAGFAGAGYDNQNHTFSGVINGTGRLDKGGSGTLTLSGANTHSGGTKLIGGTLSISADNNLGAAGDNVTFAGGSLQFTSTYITTRNLILSGSGTIDTAADHEVSGNITGAGGLTKAGSSTLTITGTNTYSGATTLKDGTLAINADSDLGNSSGVTFDGGTLKPTSTQTTNLGFTSSAGGGGIEVSPGLTYTIQSALAGTGVLGKAGSGTLVLTADNTSYTGSIALDAGTLQVDAAGNLSGSTTVITASGATLAVQDGQLVANVSGSGALIKTGANTLSFSGSKSYTGGTTISDGTRRTSPSTGQSSTIASSFSHRAASGHSPATSPAPATLRRPGKAWN